jgi:hypothetical protein
LKVKDDLAGKMGLCPVCKAKVQVPARPAHPFSEDAILDIMGKGGAALAPAPAPSPAVAAVGAAGKKDAQSPPMKTCSKCNHSIAATIHICPHCHTYIARLGDF